MRPGCRGAWPREPRCRNRPSRDWRIHCLDHRQLRRIRRGSAPRGALPMLNVDHVQAFDRDGCCLVEGMFSPEEVAALIASIDGCGRAVGDMPDANGRSSKISLWMDIADDAFGAVTRSARVVTAAQMLLREDV